MSDLCCRLFRMPLQATQPTSNPTMATWVGQGYNSKPAPDRNADAKTSRDSHSWLVIPRRVLFSHPFPQSASFSFRTTRIRRGVFMYHMLNDKELQSSAFFCSFEQQSLLIDQSKIDAGFPSGSPSRGPSRRRKSSTSTLPANRNRTLPQAKRTLAPPGCAL